MGFRAFVNISKKATFHVVLELVHLFVQFIRRVVVDQDYFGVAVRDDRVEVHRERLRQLPQTILGRHAE